MSAIETISGGRSARFRSRHDILRLVFGQIAVWYRTRRTRRQLADLSDHALQDLGLTREAALQEALRPFWDTHGRQRGDY